MAHKTSFLSVPAQEALRPEIRHFPTALNGNPFAGVPRPELDDAWHQLLQNDNIYLSRATLDSLGLKSIYTRNGSYGIASLSVFHALHCLKLVRRMMYKEYYHSNISGVALQRQLKHADHCVEYIRESLMCKPDISLVTFRWINDTAQHPKQPASFYPTNFDVSEHDCMKWEILNDWAGRRVFNLYDVDLLDRPED
ncbi:hypothetical protein K491DRAFT_702775 [Lophiostoma macrostomum CBS 122681]|uniref:Tat pathway signal sequence n=1 Tax=Lophiostoma macrostomum CBS 122681 TaxID=1314788 RepID=A0A6A6TGG5_9PLEO|nr:hypothetical protein K491DRAFT_702775 [Lophiostoma macrostomum CBS 122681]